MQGIFSNSAGAIELFWHANCITSPALAKHVIDTVTRTHKAMIMVWGTLAVPFVATATYSIIHKFDDEDNKLVLFSLSFFAGYLLFIILLVEKTRFHKFTVCHLPQLQSVVSGGPKPPTSRLQPSLLLSYSVNIPLKNHLTSIKSPVIAHRILSQLTMVHRHGNVILGAGINVGIGLGIASTTFDIRDRADRDIKIVFIGWSILLTTFFSGLYAINRGKHRYFTQHYLPTLQKIANS